ncbi:MAG: nitroreductase family protein [Candidatus Heimdallarchaeota archaeon]|nr:nitroreductase family protein [Candidatus Heimdallarchaeota archaeon]MDH5647598.1 nitroreductase family protein [Candidatus Heimdallarchaeota archaeon]
MTNEIINHMLNHRSIRKFDSNFQIPDIHIDTIIEAAQQASTSSNMQMYTIVEVPKDLRMDANLCGDQQFIKDASYFGIIFTDLHRIQRMIELQGGELKEATTITLTMGVFDAGLMSQNLVLAAESLGYGVCFCGACGDSLISFKEKLNIPSSVIPITGIAIGKSLETPERKPRLPPKLIHHKGNYLQYSDEDLQAGMDHMSSELSRIHKKEINWGLNLKKRFTESWVERREKIRRDALIIQEFNL